MMIALLVEHVLMSVLLMLLQKAIFIKSMLDYALIVAHARTFVPQKQFILHSAILKKNQAALII